MVITSACHAEGPGSIPGNSVKMWTALPHFGVAGSIPASSFWDCSSDGRALEKRCLVYFKMQAANKIGKSLS